MPEVSAWQNRPLETVYLFLFMNAIHYKVKEDHRYVTKTAYVVMEITMDGKKEILGMWIGEHESSKFCKYRNDSRAHLEKVLRYIGAEPRKKRQECP